MKEILSIILLLLRWWFGSKLERSQRAKEIAEKFQKVTKEGDKLSDQIRVSLNKKSDVEWSDIELRDKSQ